MVPFHEKSVATSPDDLTKAEMAGEGKSRLEIDTNAQLLEAPKDVNGELKVSEIPSVKLLGVVQRYALPGLVELVVQ